VRPLLDSIEKRKKVVAEVRKAVEAKDAMTAALDMNTSSLAIQRGDILEINDYNRALKAIDLHMLLDVLES